MVLGQPLWQGRLPNPGRALIVEVGCFSSGTALRSPQVDSWSVMLATLAALSLVRHTEAGYVA